MLGVIVLCLICVSIFLSLGRWQLQRLSWKETVLEEIDSRISALPVRVPDEVDPTHDKYLPVVLNGTMGAPVLRVLVSTRDEGAGYRLISPFMTEDGSVLVDRGFLRVSEKIPRPPEGPMSIIGNLHWPDDRNSSTPNNDVQGNTWFARDIDQMAATLNTRPLLIVARNVTPREASLTLLPVTSEGVANDHLEYALTWFLLAATWVVMTVFALWRMKR
jgi:surfeit locus 1 family protein